MSFYKYLLLLVLVSGVSFSDENEFFESEKEIKSSWNVAYFEGGPYTDYNKVLLSTIKGLVELGLLDNKNIPDFSESKSKDIWYWLSDNLSNNHMVFLKENFYSAGWDEQRREDVAEKLIKKSNSGKIDLIFAMGTWAGQSLANDSHDTPTLVMSASSPVSSGIIKSVDESGYAHLHATVDPNKHFRQLKLFHEITDFKKLGVAYENTVEGRSYAALDVIEGLAKSINFEIIPCFTLSDIKDQEKANESVIDCYRELSKVSDAIYITEQGGVNDVTIKEIVKIVNSKKIPSFSQSGSDEVAHGILLSLSQNGFKYVGEFHSKVIKDVLHGKIPGDIKQIFDEPLRIAINLKSAEKIGFNPPLIILGLADEIFNVIE